jgi:hypothetical protein
LEKNLTETAMKRLDKIGNNIVRLVVGREMRFARTLGSVIMHSPALAGLINKDAPIRHVIWKGVAHFFYCPSFLSLCCCLIAILAG